MSQLTNQLAIAEREEVGRAIRYLLAEPLLTAAAAPDRFDVVRRRREPVAQWFDYFCGWSLTVEPRVGYARLTKVRVATDATRPAKRQRSQRAPFDRRRYVLLCVVLAELCGTQVTTIGTLAEQVRSATAHDDLVQGFDTSSRGERRAFVDVLHWLEAAAVLHTVDGAVDSYIDSQQAKVLYRVDTTLLLRMLATGTGPSQLGIPTQEVSLRLPEVLAELTREHRYGAASVPAGRHSEVTVSDNQRNLWLRHSIFRRLADDPVVYFADLDEAARGYLASPTGRRQLRNAAETGGFVLEERGDGILFVDPDALATDSKFPDDSSTAKVAGLLLLEHLDGPATIEQLCARTTELLRRFPQWARTYQAEEGPGRLADDAVAVLAAFQLVRRTTAGLVIPLPAVARYRVRQVHPTTEPEIRR
ncbi:TIGR02678 family protein [Nocardia sp. AG03]|uniref:TIGR02678 family protein n=1 Tax=Nocardia sp. AG03 TaxID=3025312 RepID=UPI00241860C7|nr:TIGR02678 family protein [Nocardia sp. AG03]